MPIAVVCPACKAKLKAPDGLLGKTVKCPGCAKPVLVKAGAPAATPGPVAKKPAPPPAPAPIEEEPLDEAPPADEGEGTTAAPPGGPSTDKERGTAMWIYLLPILLGGCCGIGNLITLFLWISKRKESPFIDHHGKSWLNLVINVFVVMLLLVILSTVLGIVAGLIAVVLRAIVSGLFSLLMFGVAVYSLVISIMAALKAKKGEWYQPRLLFKVLK